MGRPRRSSRGRRRGIQSEKPEDAEGGEPACASIEDLPDAVLVSVFSLLVPDAGLQRVVSTLALVSYRFRDLAWSLPLADGALTREHSLHVHFIMEALFMACRSGGLRRLDLARLPLPDGVDAFELLVDFGLLHMRAAASLTHLTAAFRSRFPGPRAPSAALRCLPPLPRLEHLDLSGSVVYADALRGLLASCAPSLRAVYLSAVLVAHKGPAPVVEGAPHPASVLFPLQGLRLPALEALDLSDCVLDPADVCDFVAGLPRLARLFLARPRAAPAPEQWPCGWAEFRTLPAWGPAAREGLAAALARPGLAVVVRDPFRELAAACGETDPARQRLRAREAAAAFRAPLAAGLDAFDARGFTPFSAGAFVAARELLAAGASPSTAPLGPEARPLPVPWSAPYPCEAFDPRRPCGRCPARPAAGALHRLLREKEHSGLVPAVLALVALGADLFETDERGCTPFEALVAGDWVGRDWLAALRAIAPLQGFARRERRALPAVLAEAETDEHVETVAALVAAGADPAAWGVNGVPPVHRAAASGRTRVLRLLLRAEGAVNARTAGWNPPTALQAAVAAGEVEAARLLLEAGAEPGRGDPPPLHQAAALGPERPGAPDLVRLLVEAGAVPDARDAAGRTALHVAVEAGAAAAVAALLARGADPNAPLDGPEGGPSPLQLAAAAGRPDILDVLLHPPPLRFRPSRRLATPPESEPEAHREPVLELATPDPAAAAFTRSPSPPSPSALEAGGGHGQPRLETPALRAPLAALAAA
eukprot:tig00000989_g6105.t1